MRRKMKRTTKQYMLVALLCIVVIGGAAISTTIIITGQIRDKYTELLTIANEELEDHKRTIYVAQSDINTGDYITEDNASLQNVYTAQPYETYITQEDFGKVALIDMRVGTQIIKDMLSENIISSELRELEYNVITISSNISNHDSVDVRISYPNGESYIVLSKKLMKGFSPDTSTCYFWMDEEELLRMSAAIVDAALYTGSSLYVTKYIEPNIQNASIVNYTPSLSILTLLESDPNILTKASQELSRKVRKSLENRLAENMDKDISQINWDVNPYDPIVLPNEASANNANKATLEDEFEYQKEDDTVSPEGSELGNYEQGSNENNYVKEQEVIGQIEREYAKIGRLEEEQAKGGVLKEQAKGEVLKEQAKIDVSGEQIIESLNRGVEQSILNDAELGSEYFLIGG